MAILHHTVRKKMIRVHGHLKEDPAALRAALLTDDVLMTEADADVIMAEIMDPAPEASGTGTQKQAKHEAAPPAAAPTANVRQPKATTPVISSDPANDFGSSGMRELLDGLDYHAAGGFRGKAFEKYMEAFNGIWEPSEEANEMICLEAPYLNDKDAYFFEQYSVTSIRLQLYPGMKDSPKVLRGVRFNKDKPVSTTKIKVFQARELNAQLDTDWATNGHGIIYLLKKD